MCILLYRKCCLLWTNCSSCRSCCCWNYTYKKVVWGLLLPLFVIVCRMTQFVAAVFLRLIPVFLFFISTRYMWMHPLAVRSHLQPRFLPGILYSSYMACILEITCIRGAKASGNPPRRNPPGIVLFVWRDDIITLRCVTKRATCLFTLAQQ